MKEFTNYYGKLSKVLGDALTDIVEMFEEHNTSEILLDDAVSLGFRSRFTEEPTTSEINAIKLHNGLIVLCGKGGAHWSYELLDKADIAFLYDIVYTHFYKKN